MTLYIKPGPDGESVGDCPFAHFVRTVLHEKGLEYDVRPCTAEAKPQWLIDHYEGKLPALRHRKECYVESDVIAQYLDFFFQDPPLAGKKKLVAEAEDAVDGLFPAIARYLKHTPDGDEEDVQLKSDLEAVLSRMEEHLSDPDESKGRGGSFIVGDGESFSLLDASLAPKLYHMEIGLESLKDGAINVADKFPKARAYMDALFSRPSFQETLYSKETVVWGWSNARG